MRYSNSSTSRRNRTSSNRNRYARFRSRGEAKIARLLEWEGIDYRYEPSVSVIDEYGLDRIWHPDFQIGSRVIIEYCGMRGGRYYNEGVEKKRKIYEAHGYKVIVLKPDMIRGKNWARRLLEIIDDAMNEKNEDVRMDAA